MAELGTILGLMKTMGGTVQDGSISYNKLNSDLKETVDDVGVLKKHF